MSQLTEYKEAQIHRLQELCFQLNTKLATVPEDIETSTASALRGWGVRVLRWGLNPSSASNRLCPLVSALGRWHQVVRTLRATLSLPIILLSSWKCSDMSSGMEAWCTSVFADYFVPTVGFKNVKICKMSTCCVCRVCVCVCVCDRDRHRGKWGGYLRAGLAQRALCLEGHTYTLVGCGPQMPTHFCP